MSAYDVAQFLREGENQMEIHHGKESLPAFIEPALSVLSMALGAMAIATGMISVVKFSAPLALEQTTAQGLGPAVDDIL